MVNIVNKNIGNNTIMYMLDDGNVSKNIENAISLCLHGSCISRRDCEIRSLFLANCNELGAFAPITGCVEYEHDTQNEFKFEDEE